MRRAVRRLLRARADRRGNVAMIVALCAVPLLGMVGLAIDVGSATAARTTLDAAADSAALLATTMATNQYMAGNGNAATQAQAAATQRFYADAGTIGGVTVGSVNVAVTQSGLQFSSNVTYTAAYQTALTPVIGIKSLPLGGVSAATMAANPYVDIQVLMDVSASMLIAATPTDIAAMQTLTTNFVPALGEILPDNAKKQCAFACHWNTLGTDYLALAQKSGVTLRIDVLRSAVGNLISTIATQNKYGTFRVGLSTFAQAFTSIYPTSTNISGAGGALAQIAPDVNMCTANCPETFFSSAMTALTAQTGASGDGVTKSTPQKYLFIVTDGLVDELSGGSRVIGPISPADCQAMKNNGVTVLTLYTPYLPLPTDDFYMRYVWQYQNMGSPDHIQQAMAACATTPAMSYVASNSADIDAQLQKMLATVLQTSGHLVR